jgi:hypothetical protein
MLTHAKLFADLREKMTAQDRLYLVHSYSFALPPKAASLFRAPSIPSYEPQPTQRFAAYDVMMRTGGPMRSIQDFYKPAGGIMPRSLQRRLLDLAAAHYIVADRVVDTTAQVLRPAPQMLSQGRGVRVWENLQSLPRAFYVPRIEVVSDPEALLHRLAHGDDDLHAVALVEQAPPAGFAGTAPYDGRGTVTFVTNEPEHLVLDVQASARGFLFLSDHHFPGWEATVNGDRSPIQRANYLFRLVEVPAGRARVEFRYRPASVRIGALVSLLTLLGVLAAGYLAHSGRQNRR